MAGDDLIPKETTQQQATKTVDEVNNHATPVPNAATASSSNVRTEDEQQNAAVETERFSNLLMKTAICYRI